LKWQDRYRSEIKNELGDERRAARPLNRLKEINPASIEWLREYGIDLEGGDKIEIAPSIQHFQGGIKIRTRGECSLEGLYAAGECAGGQHGANRPGGNALLDGQVFGRIAGHEAAREAMSLKKRIEISHSRTRQFVKKLRAMRKGRKASEVRREIQSITSRFAAIVRTEEGLKKGLKLLEALRREGIAVDEQGLSFCLETENLLGVAGMVMRASLMRRESRGPHLFFSHFDDPQPLPSRDPKWRRYIVIQNQGGRMVLKKRVPVKLNGV
jgi:succinate dehydrogenase / fumarate reductase flavoprotein subunit